MTRISPPDVECLIGAAVACARASPPPAAANFDEALASAGCPQDLVRPLANFIPEAFGHVLLRELEVNVADECEFLMPDGSLRKVLLSGDAMWVLVEAVAYAMSRNPMQRQDFAAMAVHSAAVDALNRLIGAGKNPKGAIYAGVFVGIPENYR